MAPTTRQDLSSAYSYAQMGEAYGATQDEKAAYTAARCACAGWMRDLRELEAQV